MRVLVSSYGTFFSKDMADELKKRVRFHLSSSLPLELDFSGLGRIGVYQVSIAMASLLKDFSLEEMNRIVSIESVDDDGAMRVDRMLRFGSRYYCDEYFRDAINSLLGGE